MLVADHRPGGEAAIAPITGIGIDAFSGEPDEAREPGFVSVLFEQDILPKSLSQAVVTREAFANGNAYLTLSAKGLQLWDSSWASFRNG